MKLTAFSVEKFRSIIKPSQFSVFDKTVIIGPNKITSDKLRTFDGLEA